MSQAADPVLGARLRDEAGQGATAFTSKGVGQLLRFASQEPLPGAPPWTKVQRRLLPSSHKRPRALAWAAAGLCALSFAVGATAGPLVWKALRPHSPGVQASRKLAMHAPPPPAGLAPAPASAEAPPLVRAHTAQAVPAAEPHRNAHVKRRRQFAAAPAEAPQASAGPAESALAAESRMLGEALTALRKDGDAARALAHLAHYEQFFPAGQLAKEARHTKVEALLVQKRHEEALGLLDEMTFSARGRDTDMLALRGELRARARRCGDAQRDFAAVLARASAGSAAERALFGQASCWRAEGQVEQARSALEQYLGRFPKGSYHAQAKAALGL